MIVSDRLRAENRVVIAHVYTATAAIALGALFGVFQGFGRTGLYEAPAWFDYYRVLTMHGVLMALVFTTFFITGLSLFVTYRAIPRERSLLMGWFGWALMLFGTAMAAVTILKGDATVLYTFYAPLKASPWFYIGATLLILGTWVVAFEIFGNVNYYRKNNPGRPVPLVVPLELPAGGVVAGGVVVFPLESSGPVPPVFCSAPGRSASPGNWGEAMTSTLACSTMMSGSMPLAWMERPEGV